MENDLSRFIKAQEGVCDLALSEIRSGRKRSHWMWFIFPQYKGLGFSKTSKEFSIKNLEEARNYLDHPILGARLRHITRELLTLEENDAHKILGFPDDLKLQSCMTLFAAVDTSEETVFAAVLEKFFGGATDSKTLTLIKE